MAAQHTPGPWSVDTTRNLGEYGNNGPDTRSRFDSYVVFDDKGRALFDSLNSDAAEVQEEYGEDDVHAWDAVGKANLTLAAAAPELLEAAAAVAAFIGGPKDRLGRPDVGASDSMRAARAKVLELVTRYGVQGGHSTYLDQCAALLDIVVAKATGASA